MSAQRSPNPDSLGSSVDQWEFSGPLPLADIDLQEDQQTHEKVAGAARIFELMADGDITYVNASGRQVTLTGLPAGKGYPVQITKIVACAVGVRVFW